MKDTKELMQYKSYYGSAHFSPEDLLFYGEIEFISTLVSYESATAKGLKKAFEEAVDDYLDFCKENNKTPEIPLKGSLNVRLTPELHKKLAFTAKRKHISINKLIIETLTEAFD